MASDSSAAPAHPSDDAAGHSAGHAEGHPPTGAADPFTRTAALWVALIVGFLVLIVLLTFVAQNPEPVQLTFISWHWSLPLGVAILLAAVGGGLVTVLAGTARIFQLRRAVKKTLAGSR